MSKQTNWRWMTVLLAAGVLGGCDHLHLSSDYGVAVRENITAQIADPDARYTGVPQPGSNPNRVSSAQRRYNGGRVIQPASTSTSAVAGGGDGGGGGGGTP